MPPMKSPSLHPPAVTASAKLRAYILILILILLTIIFTQSILNGNDGVMAFLTRAHII